MLTTSDNICEWLLDRRASPSSHFVLLEFTRREARSARAAFVSLSREILNFCHARAEVCFHFTTDRPLLLPVMWSQHDLWRRSFTNPTLCDLHHQTGSNKPSSSIANLSPPLALYDTLHTIASQHTICADHNPLCRAHFSKSLRLRSALASMSTS